MTVMFALFLLSSIGQAAAEEPPASAPAQQRQSGLSIAGIAFSPEDIASAEQSFDGNVGTPNVTVTFTEAGRAKWQRLQQGRVGEPLDISVDGEVVASPYLMEIITGNQVTIASGGFTVEEAVALARRIGPPRR